jgi:rhodanese-related sulfurtransferase
MSLKSITVRELHDLTQSGQTIDLIDVRSPREFASVHAAGARSVPLDTLTREAALANRNAHADDPVFVICQAGGRSRTACIQLAAQGLEVVNVEGGTSAWKDAGLPVEPAGAVAGKGVWIRPAGVLLTVFLFVLGVTVNQLFIIAAAGVWIGLILTGYGPCCGGTGCSVPRW